MSSSLPPPDAKNGPDATNGSDETDRSKANDGARGVPQPHDNAGDGHLQYLLTAYLFGNISAEGKSEVDAHLAECAQCRAELEQLRTTATILESTLSAPGEGAAKEASPYSFEARRLERVLAAGRPRPRKVWIRCLYGASGLAAASWLLLFVLVQFSSDRSGRSAAESSIPPLSAAGRDSMSVRQHEPMANPAVPGDLGLLRGAAELQAKEAWVKNNVLEQSRRRIEGLESSIIAEKLRRLNETPAPAEARSAPVLRRVETADSEEDLDESVVYHAYKPTDRGATTPPATDGNASNVMGYSLDTGGKGSPLLTDALGAGAPVAGNKVALVERSYEMKQVPDFRPPTLALDENEVQAGGGGAGGILEFDAPAQGETVVRQFNPQEYDPTTKRDMKRKPEILEPEKKKPILKLKPDQIVAEIPKGVDENKLTRKNLEADSVNDAFGVRRGTAGAYGWRPGTGAMDQQPAKREARKRFGRETLPTDELSKKSQDLAGEFDRFKRVVPRTAGGRERLAGDSENTGRAPAERPSLANELFAGGRVSTPEKKDSAGLPSPDAPVSTVSGGFANQPGAGSSISGGSPTDDFARYSTDSSDLYLMFERAPRRSQRPQSGSVSPDPQDWARLEDLTIAYDTPFEFSEDGSADEYAGPPLGEIVIDLYGVERVPDGTLLGLLDTHDDFSDSVDADMRKNRLEDPRYSHTTTTLADGKVLITGDSDERHFTSLDTGEVYEQTIFEDPRPESTTGEFFRTDFDRSEIDLEGGSLPPSLKKGRVPVLDLLHYLQQQTGVFVNHPSTQADSQYFSGEGMIEILEDVDHLNVPMVKGILETNGYTLRSMRLEDGTPIIDVRDSRDRSGGPELTQIFGTQRRPGLRFLLPAAEARLRAYDYYFTLDPTLTKRDFALRPLEVPAPAVGDEGLGRDGFRERYGVNPFVDTRLDHLSTFAMDVDTASYTRVRAMLQEGKLPPPDSVRVEECINFFRQDYPADPNHAFSAFIEGGPSPFGEGVDLIKVTVKARELLEEERRPAVLTFAVDTSGSMFIEQRLALVKDALSELLGGLGPEDRVGIVAYGSQAYLALPHTPARERDRILGALQSLDPRGSTNVEAGLDLAYRVADEVLQRKAVNRVVLCSDGVATEGQRAAEEILQKVRVFADRGIYLSVVGFGKERYNDAFLEELADRGNGQYSYVDSSAEARRIFRDNLPAALDVLARDAKIQVDFDPEVVSHYRLLGYENRDIKDVDFRNDKIDAGEVGPGTTVTALYEVRRRVGSHGPLGRLFVRFHDAVTSEVQELDFPIAPGVLQTELDECSDNFRFIACVAEFAELLRDSYWSRNGTFADVLMQLQELSPAFKRSSAWLEFSSLLIRAQRILAKSAGSSEPQGAPRSQATVVAVHADADIFVISRGASHGVQRNDEFYIYRNDRFLAKGRVTKTTQDRAGVRLLYLSDGAQVQVGDEARNKFGQ